MFAQNTNPIFIVQCKSVSLLVVFFSRFLSVYCIHTFTCIHTTERETERSTNWYERPQRDYYDGSIWVVFVCCGAFYVCVMSSVLTVLSNCYKQCEHVESCQRAYTIILNNTFLSHCFTCTLSVWYDCIFTDTTAYTFISMKRTLTHCHYLRSLYSISCQFRAI